jgi:hypothetical protein
MPASDFYWGGDVGVPASKTGAKLSPRVKQRRINEINQAILKNKKTPFFGEDFGGELLRTIGVFEPKGVKTKVTFTDFAKEVPRSTITVFKELLKAPIKATSSLVQSPKTLTTGGRDTGKTIKVPLLGDVTTYYQDVQKQIENGVSPIVAALGTGSQSVLDVAILAGLAQGIKSRLSTTKTTTIATETRVPPGSGMSVGEARSILGVKPGADVKSIRASYIKLAHVAHPDKAGGSTAAMSRLNQAYRALSGDSPSTVRTADVSNTMRSRYATPQTTPAPKVPTTQPVPSATQTLAPAAIGGATRAGTSVVRPLTPTPPITTPPATPSTTAPIPGEYAGTSLDRYSSAAIKSNTYEEFLSKTQDTLAVDTGALSQIEDMGITLRQFYNSARNSRPTQNVNVPRELSLTVSEGIGNMRRAGFSSVEALQFFTQPSRWIHALDSAWFKLIGKHLERFVFGRTGGQVVPPDPYSARFLPQKVRNVLQHGAKFPPEYLKLLDSKAAEHSLLMARADKVFKMADKLSDSELSTVRAIMETGKHPTGRLGDFTKAAEQLFYDLGEGLVQVGGLKPQQFHKYARQYYPRLYRIFEGKGGGIFSRIGERLNLQYSKSRKTITPEEEKALGIIEGKHSKYPLVKRAVQEIHDVVLGRFFLAVSQHPSFASPVPMSGFVQMPKSKKLGPLSEMYVEKNVARDLESLIHVPGEVDKFIQNIYGLFKIFKVPMNLPTAGRNAISNVKLADLLGGVPPEDVPTWTKAIMEVKNKGSLYREMLEWLPSEMNNLLLSWHSTKNWQQLATTLLHKSVSYYSKMEEIGKMAVYINNRERLGKIAAGELAEYAIGNYQKVPELINQLRRGSTQGPLGGLGPLAASPFITFRYLFLPRIIASATFRRPFTFLKYELAKLWLQVFAVSYVADQLHRSRDEIEELVKSGVRYWGTRGKMVIPLPRVDVVERPDGSKEEQIQLLDVTFIEPYGDMPEFWKRAQSDGFISAAITSFGLLGNPWVTIPLQISRNQDFYAGNEITQELDSGPTKARKIAQFIASSYLPGTATYVLPDLFRSFTGQETKYGEVQSPTVQLLSTFGVRSVPYRLSLTALQLDRKLNDLDRTYRKETSAILFNKGMSQDDKQKALIEKTDVYQKKLLLILNEAGINTKDEKLFKNVGE